MAALCGPSNALTSLQKHTTADRSHQQDRSRAGSSSQGFRNGALSQGGRVENDFESFSAAQTAAATTHHHQQHSWTNDFQRLDIGGTAQHQQQRFPASAFAPQMNAQPAWGQEFSQRLQQQGVPQQQQQQQLQNNNYAAGMSGYMGYEKAFSSQLGMGMGQTMEPAQQQQTSAADFQFDESAFERAFEDAAKEAESFFYEPEPEIEPVVEEKQKQHEPFVKEGDDLARTAGALLDSVSEDTSTKFQNSNFLALMRKLRDREVVVEGDKMVEREG